ncbi:MAG: leucyl aminopeptidase family protein [Chitinophagales bacterium]
MNTELLKSKTSQGGCVVVLMRNSEDVNHPILQPISHVLKKKLGEKDNGYVYTYTADGLVSIVILKEKNSKTLYELMEEARSRGGQVCRKINAEKCSELLLLRAGRSVSKEELMACAEGIAFSNYQFNKYKKDKKQNTLQKVKVYDDAVKQSELTEIQHVIDANIITRDLANEPLISLNALQMSEKIVTLGKEYGFTTTILHKKQIESLKMGGLLGVNYGSSVPPTFSILEYKPARPKNKKPLVLVGKGVTYDTGGYSLKPAQSMTTMKADMSGAAAVIGTFCAIAKNKLPVHVVGLIPATDNKVSSDALVPDDIITMSDGTTVEVLNTDAEGRLILADALHYAKKYDPELVIDLATLTGAAAVITGSLGSALMGTDKKYRKTLLDCSNETYERLAEIPYWKEYADMLKSDVADLKNIGGGVGGSATAGKFLEHFTSYPWLHLDIAGPAFIKDDETYKLRGATGVGVRLLYAFAKRLVG